MISKKAFIDTLTAIQKQCEISRNAETELHKLGLSVSYEQTPYLQTLLDLLKAAVPDRYDYISWWLFEAADYEVTWEKDGKTVSADLKDPGALYDFLTGGDCAPDPEALPFIELPERNTGSAYPHLGIEQVDFCDNMDSVFRYLDEHDAIIHIMCGGTEKYVLMSVRVYNSLFGNLDATSSKLEKEMVTVSVQIDEELANRAREVVGKAGFTLEQATEMFLSWCALYPDDASAWLKKAMEEQGIRPRNSSMQDEE